MCVWVCVCVCVGGVVIGTDETKWPRGVIQRTKCSRVIRGSLEGPEQPDERALEWASP